MIFRELYIVNINYAKFKKDLFLGLVPEQLERKYKTHPAIHDLNTPWIRFFVKGESHEVAVYVEALERDHPTLVDY
jgi:hypothetical protein